jgi:hypothetical protein
MVIPQDKWVVLHDKYHITHFYSKVEKGALIQGVSLYEKPLDESCAPYDVFKLSRFAIHEEDVDKLRELIALCDSLNEVNIQSLMDEVETIQLEEVEN